MEGITPRFTQTVTIDWYEMKDFDYSKSQHVFVRCTVDYEDGVFQLFYYAPNKEWLLDGQPYKVFGTMDYFSSIQMDDLF